MKATHVLIAAPVGMQPGGYLREAYRDRTQPRTPAVDLELSFANGLVRVGLAWACPAPVRSIGEDPSRFCDAAALLAPSEAGAPWVTMGSAELGVDGVLWRADREGLLRVSARGLGTVVRTPAPDAWSATAGWKDGRWRVDFALRGWQSLDRQRQLAVAVWRGADGERGGLKSITPGWIEVSS